MEYRLPEPNYCNSREWDWPFNKFCLDPEELFTTLHDRFNIHKLPLQDPMAFHRDVCESANFSATLEEFYSQMEERKSERIKEMNKAWDDICVLIAACPWLLACQLCYDPKTGQVMTTPDTMNDPMPEKWRLFNYFSRTLSFDTLIRFFDGFVRDQRKKWEDRERAADEALERWRKKQVEIKRSAAAAKAMEAVSQTSPEAAHGKPESSHDALSSDTSSDKLRPSSPSGRHDAATHLSTTENSTARKRRSDEDAQGLKQKRRRQTSERARDNDDAQWIAAGHAKSEAEGPTSTTKQAEKRKRTDDSLDEQRNKRTRHSSDRDQISQGDCQDLAQTQIPPPGSYYTREEGQEGGRGEGEGEGEKDDSGYMEETHIPPQEDTEEPVVNDAATGVANEKKYKRKSQALHRQRVKKRRSHEEHEASLPQKQPRQKKRRGQKFLPSVDQLLQSKRSSRRNAGQVLLFLADDSTACVASGTRKI